MFNIFCFVLGIPVATNAFLLPQWGGFLFYNCPVPENASLPYSVLLDERAFMEVFLSQFRLLLGLPDIVSTILILIISDIFYIGFLYKIS